MKSASKRKAPSKGKKSSSGGGTRKSPPLVRLLMKKVGRNAFETAAGGFDFQVRREKVDAGRNGRPTYAWSVDQFVSRIKDADDAHVRSWDCDSYDEALRDIRGIVQKALVRRAPR